MGLRQLPTSMPAISRHVLPARYGALVQVISWTGSELKRTDLFTQYATLVAADQAIKDSGLDFRKMDPFDTGVIWGSGQGGDANI